MKKPWNRAWIYGWLAILTLAGIYEGAAAFLEWKGLMQFPTLSRLIVGTIPLAVLEPLTLAVALWLMWHWVVVRQREPRGEQTPRSSSDRIGWAIGLAGVLAAIAALYSTGGTVLVIDLGPAARVWVPAIVWFALGAINVLVAELAAAAVVLWCGMWELRRNGMRSQMVREAVTERDPPPNIFQKILVYAILIIPMAIVEALAQLRAKR